MIDIEKNRAYFCGHLKRRRLEIGKLQAEIADASGISHGYYSDIETGKSLPPPSLRMEKILTALEFCETEAYELLQMSGLQRGLAYGEADLPPGVQDVIKILREHGTELTPRFCKGLVTCIKEVL